MAGVPAGPWVPVRGKHYNIKYIFALVIMFLSWIFGVVALGGDWVGYYTSSGVTSCYTSVTLTHSCACGTCTSFAYLEKTWPITVPFPRFGPGGAWVFFLLFMALLVGVVHYGLLILMFMGRMMFQNAPRRHPKVVYVTAFVHAGLCFAAWFFYCVICYTDSYYKLNPLATPGFALGLSVAATLFSTLAGVALVLGRNEPAVCDTPPAKEAVEGAPVPLPPQGVTPAPGGAFAGEALPEGVAVPIGEPWQPYPGGPWFTPTMVAGVNGAPPEYYMVPLAPAGEQPPPNAPASPLPGGAYPASPSGVVYRQPPEGGVVFAPAGDVGYSPPPLGSPQSAPVAVPSPPTDPAPIPGDGVLL